MKSGRGFRLSAGVGGASVLTALAAGYWLMLSSFSQRLGNFPYRGETTERVVALTFDDGPNEPFTSQLADVLRNHAVRATFFQVGRCVQRHPEVTARLAADGHIIGNHSDSHSWARCIGRKRHQQETAAAQQILTDALGKAPGLYRPPWLFRTPSLFKILGSQGLRSVSGIFCHPFEVFQPPAERIARRALSKVRPGSILIFHDGFDARGGNRAQTVAAVDLVVRALTRDGYRFVTVDDLLKIPPYQLGVNLP